jgi:hypothetical protein
VDDDGVEFEHQFVGIFEVFAEVDGEGVLHELADLAHGVGEAFELEGDDFGDGAEEEAFAGVAALLALLAEVFVVALKFFDSEEAAHAFQERVRPLAFLTLYPDCVRC